MTRNELIGKLEEISALYANAVSIRSEMDRFTPEDHYERKIVVPEFPGEYKTERIRELWRDKLEHTYDGILEIAERTHREVFAPKEPEKPTRKEFSQSEDQALVEKQKKLGCFSSIAIGVAAFFLLGALFGVDESTSDTLPTILGIAAIAAVAFGFLKFKQKATKAEIEKKLADAKATHERQQEAIMADYAEKLKAYESELAVYEQGLQKFLGDYKAWRAIYLQSVNEEAQIAEKLEADRVAAVEKIYEERYIPAETALNEANNLVTEEYLPVLNIIIDLLRSGRADDLKEAINLYEDIVYRERQLALEREKEEQRQREEQMRRQDEERHHKEQMKFQQDQERQRRREEERRQQDAERRHREEMDQRDRQERDRQLEERRRADEERRRADRAELDRKQKEDRDTRDQCNRCAQTGHCSMAFRRPNCASFRPR